MRFEDAVAGLDARTNYERSGRLTSPTLERIKALLDMLGDPQNAAPVIHITGTNGKTTTARAATEVLRAANLGVATYTSPHLETVRERLAFDAQPITEDAFVEVWRELAPYFDHIDTTVGRVTWFEAITAMAFVWFADKGSEVSVLEVGMGGSWDATNVADADVAAISRIDVDHAHVLGDTPAKIAREKAGIIKPGSVVVTSHQEPDVLDVLRGVAEEQRALLRVEGEHFEVEQTKVALGGQVLGVRLGERSYGELFVPLFGEQYARDVLLGMAAAHAFLGEREVDADLLTEAAANMRVPGRTEIVHREPLVLLDGAHNPAAARALVSSLHRWFDFERLWLVISAMADKDIGGMLEPLLAAADHVIVTRNTSPRALSTDALFEQVRARTSAQTLIVQNVADAVSVAIERAESRDCVLVTGSLYTVGEARTRLASASSSKETR